MLTTTVCSQDKILLVSRLRNPALTAWWNRCVFDYAEGSIELQQLVLHRSAGLALTESNGRLATRLHHFLRCHTKVYEGAWTESECQRDIGGVAAEGDQNPADPRIVVARIKRVPAPTQKHLDPSGKVLGRMRRRKADVADVPGAIASRDVEASAKSEGQMGIVTTHAMLFLESLGSGAR